MASDKEKSVTAAPGPEGSLSERDSVGRIKMSQILSIRSLSKSFHINKEDLPVLNNINLDIADGEFLCMVGHSGCGKSTLLKIIAGLVDYSQGSIDLEGNELSRSDMNRLMIFQDHRLLPWLTVEENIGFTLYDVPANERKDLVQTYIELVHLRGFEKAYPHQLSGGMAQRASIARALIHQPRILLLDEPFGALDALTRIEMQREVLNIWQTQHTTMILVTHDIDEAIYLGDRIVIVSKRPATIKREFKVDLPRERNRTDPEFMRLKAGVFEQFFEVKQPSPDYVI